MAMPAQHTEWTVEMVRALPDDGNRYEVVGGELFVTPAATWTHQRAVSELLVLLVPYLRQHRLGDAIVAPADVVFGPRNAVEPDLFVVPLVGSTKPRAFEEVGRLLPVVEVLSASTRRTDRTDKLDLYRRKGIPEYWIVDTDDRNVERWRPDDTIPEALTEALEWRPDAATAPLVIDLGTYFDRVNGLAV